MSDPHALTPAEAKWLRCLIETSTATQEVAEEERIRLSCSDKLRMIAAQGIKARTAATPRRRDDKRKDLLLSQKKLATRTRVP